MKIKNNNLKNDIPYLYDNKAKIQAMIELCQKNCGKNSNMQKLFKAVLEYADIKSQSPDLYDNELLVLARIMDYVKDAIAITDIECRDIEKLIGARGEIVNSLTPKRPKKQDPNNDLLIKRAYAKNRKTAASSIERLFADMLFGTLPLEECPEELATVNDTIKQHLSYPVFTHTPLGTDISQTDCEKNKFFAGLSNFAKAYPQIIASIFRDCRDNNAIVRLWDEEKQENVFVKLNKNDVYVDWIVIRGNLSLWPGLLCSAIMQCGLSIAEDDPKKLLQMIAGKDVFITDDILTDYDSSENSQPKYH